ncbi:hypothetical protein HMPREF0519_1078 [Lentilactobacillus hilgardii DSM 20176 = ATCC 8290]|uniref:Uncharacterized protein n=1 Tax=Lentilactobacillus hilgardii (strain ATCC 8290 / DSM 20176 / CCUG 30140 / JCM 1155 / KCTC 3500 / NBRC 15886 / NCIMB 8040 / NRRL B-1843 / 9) TaxID=1423757 RepID=C0XIL7_LENH9|nr:hypothetical protein HMPREF0519_1078 [Lentilactobacillus hilgardii DSM 20176 = ATCC 8290]
MIVILKFKAGHRQWWPFLVPNFIKTNSSIFHYFLSVFNRLYALCINGFHTHLPIKKVILNIAHKNIGNHPISKITNLIVRKPKPIAKQVEYFDLVQHFYIELLPSQSLNIS